MIRLNRNRLAKLLADEPERVTRDHMARLRKAQKENTQLGGAFDVDHALGRIERALAISSEGPDSPEPF